ncbi:flagellar hook protein FlgE [Galbitalea soli]|uniref:Flagellar hook protein FlgE n=1 Tax=Galbitalea soli TaxID=1268042 RepID=A0A7C9TQV9_9MICO|nr:flagellar hook protein FlgE [Galbitalea soli]NEM91181.1 flagellar hook protein FlgE [Galbitalea soli]NYJ29870.1 flagellar hook protein FlgE [Galbitalea soli]
MLRSLYSGISGLRSHQTMLDVTGNNIANVNTTGFKSSATQFRDTLSQMTHGAGGAQDLVGGTNPAQVGLGVLVAGISTNFTQGSAQATGRSTDMMISGDGFFVTKIGTQTLYTRAGSFDPDSEGRLVSPDGAIVQGWPAVNGVIPDGSTALGPVTIPRNAVSPAVATSTVSASGNLPADASTGTALTRDIDVYSADGSKRSLAVTFTKSATGWDVAATDPNGATGAGTMTFNADGTLASGGSLTVGGIAVDLSALTGYASLSTVSLDKQDGRTVGTLESFSLSKDGTLVGSFSNGETQAIARIALATFVNPGGLEKAGSSEYTATINSGTPQLGTAGTDGFGSLIGGSLEMSNVDLSQEFTNLIVAQRGFQANARIITTSDEVLQELTNLKH